MTKGIEIYRPSNGTEGKCFLNKFCDNCATDVNHCEIQMNSELYDEDDKEYPTEWQYLNNEPVCTKFEEK